MGKKVVVLYNQVGEDEYEKLKDFDESELDFEPEYDIDVATVQEEYENIVKALRSAGFEVGAYNVEEKLSKLRSLVRKHKPDVIFNLVEHFHDDSRLESAVAGLFELYQIPYTGCPAFALTLCGRKGLAKQVLMANDLPTPRYRLLWKSKFPRRHGLKYPIIVKPAREDASVGVEQESVVDNIEQLDERVAHAFQEYDPPIMMEEFIQGRELHVSVLGNNPPVVLPILEYDFADLPEGQRNIISYSVKWDPTKENYHRVHTICPAKLPTRVRKRIEEISVRAFKVMNCRDYARLDIRLSPDNKVYVLEVNPNPDLTEGVSFMESAEKAGLSFSKTLQQIVDMALERGA